MVHGRTDIGRVRSNNQDIFSFRIIENNLLFAIVCDGMGGENAGKLASKMACDIIHEDLNTKLELCKTPEEIKNLILTSVSNANIQVYEKSLTSSDFEGMGTTAVVAVVKDDTAYIAHVGDSRAYLFKDEVLYQVTKDHSLVQTLLEEGTITEKEVADHPRKNLITRAVGVTCLVDIDFIQLSGMEKAGLLLCSDGLTNVCNDKIIRQILTDTAKDEVVDTLINLSNRMGGPDNITAVYII